MAIDFLGMTVAEFASRLPSQWSTRKNISPQLVCDWKRGYRRPNDKKTHTGLSQIETISQLIANKLSSRYGRDIGVRIVVNSPWKVTAWTWCRQCRDFHELKRWNQKCKRNKQK